MPSYNTGNDNLNAAFGTLAQALFPNPNDVLKGQYTRAATTKAQMEAEKSRVEGNILRERQAAQGQMGTSLGEHLTQVLMPDQPGVSAQIAGPPTPEVQGQSSFLRDFAKDLALREGNSVQIADGLQTSLGTLGVAMGPQNEDALRRSALLLSDGASKYERGQAITTGQQTEYREDDQSQERGLLGAQLRSAEAQNAANNARAMATNTADNERLLAIARDYNLHNVGENQIAVRPGSGEIAARGHGVPDPNAPPGQQDLYPSKETDDTALNILNRLSAIAKTRPLTPEEQRDYQVARGIAMQGQLYKDADGATRMRPGLIRGDEYPPMTGPAPEGQVDLTAGTVSGPGAPAGMAPPAAGAGLGMAPPAGGDPVISPGPSAGQDLAVESARSMRLDASFVGSVERANEFFGFNRETGELLPDSQRFKPSPAAAAVRAVLPDYLANYFQGEEEQTYGGMAFTLVEPLLRLRSGAATPDPEVARYFANLIPRPGMKHGVALQRMRELNREADIAREFARFKGMDLNQIAGIDPATAAEYRAFAASRGSQAPGGGRAAGATPPPDIGSLDEAGVTKILQSYKARGVRPPADVTQAIAARLNQLGVQ